MTLYPYGCIILESTKKNILATAQWRHTETSEDSWVTQQGPEIYYTAACEMLFSQVELRA
uniref:Uncharacterized protein n=1 Tax=Lotus japonicus TaxID=34305 RepID=I3SZC4_LOTJA|nr:unknown [Lotus japonicus]